MRIVEWSLSKPSSARTLMPESCCREARVRQNVMTLRFLKSRCMVDRVRSEGTNTETALERAREEEVWKRTSRDVRSSSGWSWEGPAVMS